MSTDKYTITGSKGKKVRSSRRARKEREARKGDYKEAMRMAKVLVDGKKSLREVLHEMHKNHSLKPKRKIITKPKYKLSKQVRTDDALTMLCSIFGIDKEEEEREVVWGDLKGSTKRHKNKRRTAAAQTMYGTLRRYTMDLANSGASYEDVLDALYEVQDTFGVDAQVIDDVIHEVMLDAIPYEEEPTEDVDPWSVDDRIEYIDCNDPPTRRSSGTRARAVRTREDDNE